MPKQLHVLIRTPDELHQQLVANLPQRSDLAVEVVDLTEGTPDYRLLVERIFAADSIVVW